eukprot:711358-Hanusia_phi.AAC.1
MDDLPASQEVSGDPLFSSHEPGTWQCPMFSQGKDSQHARTSQAHTEAYKRFLSECADELVVPVRNR